MTAIYIPPAPPGQGSAAVSFSGELEVTGPGNAAFTQKAVFLARAAKITAAWVSGIDGLDGQATGQTVVRLADRPWDQQGGAAGLNLTLSAGQSAAVATGEIEIPAGGWLYLFIAQATGGHFGAQVGLEISWQE